MGMLLNGNGDEIKKQKQKIFTGIFTLHLAKIPQLVFNTNP